MTKINKFALLVLFLFAFVQSAHGEVTSQEPRVQYEASASQTVFTIPFKFYQDDDIEVYDNGVLVSAADYTITGEGEVSGGTLTFDTGQTTGDVITIVRVSEIKRTTNFSNSNFTANALNSQIDKLTTFVQEVSEFYDRAIKIPVTSLIHTLTMDDIVEGDEGKVLIVDTVDENTHVANFTLGPDVSDLDQTVADATAQAVAAAASASAASTSASNSSSSASAASASAASATASAAAASVSASAASTSASAASTAAATFSGTSASSVTIGTGSKSFTTQSGKSFSGNQLCIASAANAANYMHGAATSYSSTSLTVNVNDIGGAGTFSDWVINVCGTQGPQGPTGATGPQGPTGASGAGTGDMLSAQNLADVANAATARTNLGLGTIATQAANSVNISGGTITGITDISVADGGTGSSTAAAARTALGVVIGTDVQAYDADLAALAGVTSAADRLPYFTGSGAATVTIFTSAGRALVDDADASAQRTTLGLGSAATLTAGTSANNVVQLDGTAKLPAVDGSQLTNLPATSDGNDYEIIGATTASASSSIDFMSLSSSCAQYEFIVQNLRPSTDGTYLCIRTSTNNSTFDSSASHYHYYNEESRLDDTVNFSFESVSSEADMLAAMQDWGIRGISATASCMRIGEGRGIGNGSSLGSGSETISGTFRLTNPSNATTYKQLEGDYMYIDGSGITSRGKFNGTRTSVGDIDAVSFRFGNGTMTSGTITAACKHSS